RRPRPLPRRAQASQIPVHFGPPTPRPGAAPDGAFESFHRPVGRSIAGPAGEPLMANFFTDNEDMLYYFDKGVDWEPRVRVTERGIVSEEAPADTAEAVALYRDMATMIGEFAAEEIAPVVKEMDAEGVHLENGEAVLPAAMNRLFDRIRELDLHWMCLPRELGGMNCPSLLYFVNAELFARADVSVMAHHGFHGGMAVAMLLFSIREGSTTFEGARIDTTRFRTQIEEIASSEG